MAKTLLKLLAWGLTVVVSAIAIFAWGDQYKWQLLPLSAYQIFPLFGLLAFSLMWTHYVVAVARNVSGQQKDVIKGYFEVTSAIVLAAILIHPSLLAYQLFKDGLGVPPGSIVDNYVAPGLGSFVFLAEVSLLAFLAFELHRWFSKKPWWIVIAVITDLAMIGILVHSLQLGQHLQDGWLKSVWYFYGFTLVLSIVYLRFFATRRPAQQPPPTASAQPPQSSSPQG